ncbi:MAG TPA: FAD-dependent oxidoreductase [Terriglobales bacterium]|nr:FAD-dependent oxidoreductase [Terriglobales bacterium]
MTSHYDFVVIGGGPAGCSAAIRAARAGKKVLLLERGRLPRHKVCGEFISPEATDLLRELLGPSGDALLAAAPRIARARLFLDGRTLDAPLSEPALSIPRFRLDEALWNAALAAGADCRLETQVDDISRPKDFEVAAAGIRVSAAVVVNASGRWSNLTRTSLPANAPRWLGVKAHFREPLPPQSCDLYFFDGGYCGVQPIGDHAVNACAMVRSDVANSLGQVLTRHQDLWRRSRDWEPLTEPVSTAPLVFREPHPLGSSGVINAGDAAGFIDPFAGDGIAIALRCGAKAASSPAGAYAEWHARQIVPAFRAAARFRAVVSAPRWLRAAGLALLGDQRVAAWAFRATRSRVKD